MPSRLPDNIKSLVIQQWLKGEQRDKIAVDNGLSAGAVTNIVNEWRQALGFSIVDALRELALTLKRIGITPAQCAVGFRVAMMMNKLGVKEDSFESFMSDVYNRSSKLGLTPETIASYLTNLLEFSTTVLFSQIPDYIQQKTQEKKKLEEEIEKLKEQKEDLERQKSIVQNLRDIALQNEKITTDKLKWYSDIKAELGKYGIPVDDISRFARAIEGFRQYGYDVQDIVNAYSNLDSVGNEYNKYLVGLAGLKNQYNTLNQQCSSLQQTLNSWNQTISQCNELYRMGFGLKELKFLWHTVREIAGANNISLGEAVQKFFRDIDEQYDDKLGFESKIDKLRAEVNRLTQEEARLRTQLLILPLVSPSLIRLFQKGVSEQDIVDIAELVKNDGPASNNSSGITIEEIRSLIAELRKYGSIKSTISQMSQKIDKLRNQVASLRAEKQNLHTENQRMFTMLMYSKEIVSFFSGSSVALRNEITGLVSIIVYVMYLLNIEAERLKKLQDDDLSKFAPLIRSASGEAVSLPELKSAMAKAIEVMLGKLNNDDDNKISRTLSEALTALMTSNSSKN
jgi:cell division protein FtsB